MSNLDQLTKGFRPTVKQYAQIVCFLKDECKQAHIHLYAHVWIPNFMYEAILDVENVHHFQ